MPPFTENPDALVAAAAEAYSRDDLPAAEAYLRHALTSDPQHVAPLGALGAVLHGQRRFREAEEIFAQLTVLEPQEPAYWMNLGTAQRNCGKLPEALTSLTQASQLGANSAEFLFNVGLTHIDRRDFESGRAVLAQAVALAPQDAEFCYQYAVCCYERLKTDEALGALADWESMSGLSSEITADIGLLLMKLGAPERAEPAIRRAIAGADPGPQPLLTLIQLLERTNRLDEAASRLQQLLVHPLAATLGSELDLIQAQLAQRASDHATAAKLFAALSVDCQEHELQHLLQFPLAKSLDALGRHDEAFDTLLAAHRSQRALLQMTAPVLSARGAPSMAITRFGCDPADIAQWHDPRAPATAESPIFIVAFPRSGTTLLELTLDAHPALVSMDEQPFVQGALDDMIAAGGAYPESLGGLSPADLDEIRRNYWRRTRGKATLRTGQRLVDKNPLNILRLPAIRRLFPNAPIILAVRHPCDVMLSCFMQHFRTPDFALLCSDLETLAVGYRRTFDFWYAQRELLQPHVMELRYETFTQDFAHQVREVLGFLQLPWDDAVLQPQENARSKGFISTPSYSQVIEPVNNKGIGRWHAYARHFAGVLPIVEPYLQRWGYAGLGSSNSK